MGKYLAANNILVEKKSWTYSLYEEKGSSVIHQQ